LNIEDLDFESLVPELDEERTIAKAKHFLMRTFPRLQRVSHIQASDLKSPSMDGMPKVASAVNHTDDKIVKRLAAEEAVNQVIKAINGCTCMSRQILIKLYIQHHSDTTVTIDLHLTRSHYFDKYKPLALLEFADALSGVQELRVFQGEVENGTAWGLYGD
jgi:ArpU family phage transcriptional regulator